MSHLAVQLAQLRGQQSPGLYPLPDVPSPFTEQIPPLPGADPQYRVPITDSRAVAPRDRKNVSAPSGVVEQLIAGAKARGLDPSTVLAVSLQESGLGVEDEGNPLRIRIDKHNVPTVSAIPASLDLLRQKLQTKGSEVRRLQRYNGTGILSRLDGGDTQQTAYGLPLPIDMAKTPVYGERVVELRDHVIKKNPGLMALMEHLLTRK